MEVGQMWAYRKRAYTVGYPVVKAEILQFGPQTSGKVRVRLHDGEYSGLDLWVPKVRLRVPWNEAEAWLQDERALEAARLASEGAKGSIVYQAADVVFSAYPGPQEIMLNWPWGAGTLCISEPAAAAAYLGLELQWLLSDPLAFIDRNGEYYAPASVAERLAPLIAAKYPEQVLAAVAKEEQQLREEALHGKAISEDAWWPTQIPPEKCAEYLREREPIFDLVREWCGQPAVERFDEVSVLRNEVRRLKELVLQAAQRLDEVGGHQLASKFRKEVKSLDPDSKQSSLRFRAAGENSHLRSPTNQLPVNSSELSYNSTRKEI